MKDVKMTAKQFNREAIRSLFAMSMVVNTLNKAVEVSKNPDVMLKAIMMIQIIEAYEEILKDVTGLSKEEVENIVKEYADELKFEATEEAVTH